jgi:hypothetical protein
LPGYFDYAEGADWTLRVRVLRLARRSLLRGQGA